MVLWGVLVVGWVIRCLFYHNSKEEKRQLWLNVIKRKHWAPTTMIECVDCVSFQV